MKAAWVWIVAVAAGGASAQGLCPRAEEVGQAQMLGTWQVEFQGAAAPLTLVLEKHDTYAESLSGTLDRGGEQRQVAGDLEDGEFTMEESADAVHNAGTSLGDVVEGSCGREIRGTWQAEGDRRAHGFVLRKQ
jgi:hypothetical protein